jgi:hypothetical protein
LVSAARPVAEGFRGELGRDAGQRERDGDRGIGVILRITPRRDPAHHATDEELLALTVRGPIVTVSAVRRRSP